MAYQVPTHEPRDVIAGDSWQWDISYADFPASDGWQLTYYVRGEDDFATTWNTEVTADGDGFEVRIPASSTNLATGSYRLIGRVALAGEVHTVYNGHLLVVANPVTAVGAASFNRQMLAAIETALLAGVSSSTEVKSVTVNGRSTEYRTREELEKARAHYSLLVAIEENPHGSIDHEAVFSRA